VRSLERELGNLARKAVRDLMRETAIAITVDASGWPNTPASRSTATARRSRGPGRHRHRAGWTEFGGDILTIEAVKMPARAA
jgi:ATP-dependent Lon protease